MNKDTKLYYYKNVETGKYLTLKKVEDKIITGFTEKIWMAYLTTREDANFKNNSFEVGFITLDEYQKIYSPIVSEILVLGDLLHMKYENYNEAMPVIPGDHKHLRNSISNAKSKLKTFHQQIDNILADPRSHENDLYETQGAYDELIGHISNIASLNDIQAINRMLESWKKDSKSVDGIVNKILK
jgi:hypothetical protein